MTSIQDIVSPKMFVFKQEDENMVYETNIDCFLNIWVLCYLKNHIMLRSFVLA